MLRDDTGGMPLRFVQGRPVNRATEDFLDRVCERLATESKRALPLVWDNAGRHVSKRLGPGSRSAINGASVRPGYGLSARTS